MNSVIVSACPHSSLSSATAGFSSIPSSPFPWMKVLPYNRSLFWSLRFFCSFVLTFPVVPRLLYADISLWYIQVKTTVVWLIYSVNASFLWERTPDFFAQQSLLSLYFSKKAPAFSLFSVLDLFFEIPIYCLTVGFARCCISSGSQKGARILTCIKILNPVFS